MGFLAAVSVAAGAGAVGLSHGPLVGAVGADEVRLWARVDGSAGETHSLAFDYGEVGDPVGTTSVEVEVGESGDFSGTVVVSGLAAGTEHWFRARVDDELVVGAEGGFSTAPPPGAAGVFTFALGSCNDHLEMPYPVFDAVAAQDPAFLLHAGDLIYADRAPAATVQSEFEERYKLNFAEPSWRALMADVPSFMTWDDHEIENDWNAGQTGLYLEARPAFEEYVASHNPEPRLPGELYYDFNHGDADFFVLDSRSHRDPSADTLLGAEQRQELQAWLLESTATFKFIVSSVQWSDISQKADTWFGFPEERAALYAFIRDHGIPGVVLLSGDRHWVGLFRHDAGPPYALYEISSSPLGAAVGKAPAPDPSTLYLDDSGRAFVTVTVDTQAEPATVGVVVRDESGAQLHQLTFDETEIFPQAVFDDGFESGDTGAWTATTGG